MVVSLSRIESETIVISRHYCKFQGPHSKRHMRTTRPLAEMLGIKCPVSQLETYSTPWSFGRVIRT